MGFVRLDISSSHLIVNGFQLSLPCLTVDYTLKKTRTTCI